MAIWTNVKMIRGEIYFNRKDVREEADEPLCGQDNAVHVGVF